MAFTIRKLALFFSMIPGDQLVDSTPVLRRYIDATAQDRL
jgi:hypothetical protein